MLKSMFKELFVRLLEPISSWIQGPGLPSTYRHDIATAEVLTFTIHQHISQGWS